MAPGPAVRPAVRCPGGPISRASTIVRLLPDTASRWVRSVASKASCRSGGTRGGVAHDQPGQQRARRPGRGRRLAVAQPGPQSAGQTLDAGRRSGDPRRLRARHPQHGRDAVAVVSGGAQPGGQPQPRGGQQPLPLRRRTPGRDHQHGVRTAAVGAVRGAVPRSTSASSTTEPGMRMVAADPGTWSSRGSEVTVNSAVIRRGLAGQCGHRASSHIRAVQSGGGRSRGGAQQRRGRGGLSRRPRRAPPTGRAARAHQPAPPRPHDENNRTARRCAHAARRAPPRRAAAAQAASAGGTSRRSAGPSWRGSAAPEPVARAGVNDAGACVMAVRGPEVREAAVADPVDLTEFVDGAETAVLGAVVDDVLGQYGTDARQGVELFHGGGVEAHRSRRPRHRRAGARRDPGGPVGAGRAAHHDLFAVHEHPCPVSPVMSVPVLTPPAARSASATLDPAGSRGFPAGAPCRSHRHIRTADACRTRRAPRPAGERYGRRACAEGSTACSR